MNGKRALPALREPGACLEGLWRRTPDYVRWTFLSAVVLGLGTHLYMFTNKLTNHDDIGHLLHADYGTASGRWLLPPILRLDGPFSTPWLIGLLSILCLAGAACFTVSLLRIRRPLSCALTAAVLVSFPTVAATFSYMFSADAYFLSLLLAALGAWASVRRGWTGSALGAAALTLSLGIYQAYFPIAAALMVGALLFETLDGEKPLRALLLKGVRLAATLAAGLAAYMAVVRLTTRDHGLVDYMGLQDMGKLSLPEIPRLVLESYGRYVTFYLKDDTSCHFGFLTLLFPLMALGTVALAASLLRRRHLGPARTALALALALVYPLAADLIYLMVPGGGIHTLMIYGLAYLLLAPLALADYASPFFREGAGLHAAVSWLAALTVGLTSWSYMITDNSAYLKIDLSMRQIAAYSDRLLARIECCEGYEPGMDVVLVGSDVREDTLAPTPELYEVQLIGVFDMGGFRTAYSYERYLRYYLGFTDPVYTGDTQRARDLAAAEQVRAMPLYPLAGSVRIVDGAVVVRLN